VIDTCVCFSGGNISIYGCKIAEPVGKTDFSLICTFQSCSSPIRTTGLLQKSRVSSDLALRFNVGNFHRKITVVAVSSRRKAKHGDRPPRGVFAAPRPAPSSARCGEGARTGATAAPPGLQPPELRFLLFLSTIRRALPSPAFHLNISKSCKASFHLHTVF